MLARASLLCGCQGVAMQMLKCSADFKCTAAYVAWAF